MYKVVKVDYERGLIALKSNEPITLKLNDEAVVSKKKAKRSMPQNAFYWCYLTFCLEAGLKEQGHFSTDALHEDIKSWLKETYPHEYKKGFSSADCNKPEFSALFELIDRELMIKFFEISTAPFFKLHEDFVKWRESNNGTFRDFLNEKE
jgi:hypothetical protein